MKILLRFFGKNYDEPTSIRWMSFAAALEQQGHTLLTIEQRDHAELGIWVDFDSSVREDRELWNRRILVQIEPKSVHPVQYSSRVQRCFCYVFCEDDTRPPGKIYWQSGQLSISDLEILKNPPAPKTRPYKVGLINSNKNSAVKGSLYPLRRRVIQKLSVEGQGFVYAGVGWDSGVLHNLKQDLKECAIFVRSGLPLSDFSIKPRWKRMPMSSCLGEQSSAREFLSSLEIAIVIENESNYFSEKLTDALFARCHVVYVGPNFQGISKLRNVTIASPCEKDILAKVTELMSANLSGLSYTSEEVNILRGLTTDDANSQFVNHLNKIIKKLGVFEI